MALSEPFVWGPGGARLTPEEIARERELALALQQNDFSPVGHWSQGAARVLNSLGGVLREKRADQASAANAEADSALIQALLGGGGASASASSPGAQLSAAPAQAGDMAPYQNAIAGIESGGRYDAVGPAHPKLGRALGKYQVMEANVGPWSQAALGRAVTPDEFLANPQIQDAVFNHQFGQYVSKYGSEGAAQAWFAGPGGIGTNRQDSLGTSVPEYAAKFNAALGGQQPVRVASANGADFGPVAQALAQSQPQAQAPSPVAQALAQAPQQPQRPQINPAIMEALTSPYASREAKAIAQSMLQQQMQAQQQANDPLRRLQLERAELENEALRNPQTKPTDDMREYEFARSQGYQGTFRDFEIERRKASSSTTNVNVGEGDKFYENLDKKNAETFSALSDAGMTGRSRLAQLNQLETLLQQSPTGAGARLKLWLGDLGINSDGLDNLQATRALVEKMVPEQRAPGSGPMSDADIAMYRNSLPNVVNQPGGNALIVGTAKAIAQYDMQMGAIADAVADREITPAEGRRRIRELQNPLDGYRQKLEAMGVARSDAKEASSSGKGAPSPGHVEQGYRFKGGNPADPNNWERL